MKTKAATNSAAGAEEQPVGFKGDNLKPEETKTGVLISHKERLANHIQSLKPLVRSKKFLAISGAVVLLLVSVFAVPLTRYKVLGLFLKRDFRIAVQDTTTKRMVSGATVEIDGKSFVTNKDGVAELKSIKVGDRTVTITKKHYKELTTETLVTLQKDRTVGLNLEATGRQVPVVVKNKVGGAPVSDALLKADDSDARTDKDGMAVIVIPVGSDEVKAKLMANGYNDMDVTIRVTESAVPENIFTVTPVGKVYFLSRQSGKLDVVKTNLDGSDRQVVVAGTGNEEEYGTILLASRDWKYLALHSRREGSKSKLYLIETESGKLTNMDEGDANFSVHGWAGHNFVYSVGRNKQAWEPKRSALKSFNAETKQISLLTETQAEGHQYDYVYEYITNVTVFENIVVFSKPWSSHYYSGYRLASKSITIASVGLDGRNGKQLKALSAQSHGLEGKLYAPHEIVFRYNSFTGSPSQFFEYEDSAIKDTKDITEEQYQKPYPTYLLSPSGNHTLWSDSRDGKNVLFIGDKEGKDEKMIASFAELTPFGWYSDDYVLVTKKGSELYIMPKTGAKDESGILKVSNYHRPNRSFYGYGGGYGGL